MPPLIEPPPSDPSTREPAPMAASPTAPPDERPSTQPPDHRDHKGDGCRTALQQATHPFGRTRVTQLVGSTPRHHEILSWITGHRRPERHAALWFLLEAGFNAHFGTIPVTPPADCGTRRRRAADADKAAARAAAITGLAREPDNRADPGEGAEE